MKDSITSYTVRVEDLLKKVKEMSDDGMTEVTIQFVSRDELDSTLFELSVICFIAHDDDPASPDIDYEDIEVIREN